MREKLPFFLTEEMNKVINHRRTHYFHPLKVKYFDYNVNLFTKKIENLQNSWKNEYKPLIHNMISQIVSRKYTPGDDDNFMSGIESHAAASARAEFRNMISMNKSIAKKNEVIASMYSQFFHMMASTIEAATIHFLHENKAIKDRFDRNILYGTCNNKNILFHEIEGFIYYDKLYTIWNFIKHNSESTFMTVIEKFPEVLNNNDYVQGQLAIKYVIFNDELIEVLLLENIKFFKKYFSIVYNENYEEAQWNYEDYFKKHVYDQIEDIENPMGYDMFSDLD